MGDCQFNIKYKYPSFDLVDLELKSEPRGSSAYWLSRCCLYNQYLHLLCQLTSIDACECAYKLLSFILFIFFTEGGTGTFPTTGKNILDTNISVLIVKRKITLQCVKFSSHGIQDTLCDKQ